VLLVCLLIVITCWKHLFILRFFAILKVIWILHTIPITSIPFILLIQRLLLWMLETSMFIAAVTATATPISTSKIRIIWIWNFTETARMAILIFIGVIYANTPSLILIITWSFVSTVKDIFIIIISVSARLAWCMQLIKTACSSSSRFTWDWR